MKIQSLASTIYLLSIIFVSNYSAQIVFEKIYKASIYDEPYDISQVSDGGYVITGESSISGNGDLFILRISQNGDSLWTKHYGGSGSDRGESVLETKDGGFIISGFKNYNLYIIKTDNKGNKIWEQVYNAHCVGSDILETSDGGYIIAGSTKNYKASLVKTDSLGAMLWDNIYDRVTSNYFLRIIQTMDGGYIAAGDDFIIKTDDNGETIWERNDLGTVMSIKQTADSGYIVLGNGFQIDGGLGDDVKLIRIDQHGNWIWSKIFLSTKGLEVFTSDNGYIYGGIKWEFNSYDYKGIYLVKTDMNGDTNWTQTFSTSIKYNRIMIVSLIACKDGGYIFTGTTDYEWLGNIIVIKIREPSNPTKIKNENIPAYTKNYSLSQNYPNPFNPKTIIKYTLPAIETGYIPSLQIKIYDILGKEISTILDRKQKPGNYEIEFDGSDLSGGIYLYRLKTDKFTEVKKMVLMK